MKRFIIGTLSLAAALTGGYAQTYTLGSCLETGLENNYSLRITRNEENIAHNNATYSNAGMLPTIDIAAGYNGNLSSGNAKLRATGETERTRNEFGHTLNTGIDVNWTIFDGFNASTTYKQLKEMERMGDFIINISQALHRAFVQK